MSAFLERAAGAASRPSPMHLEGLRSRRTQCVANVLVVGGSRKAREQLAIELHRSIQRGAGLLTRIYCDEQPEHLRRTFAGLCRALTVMAPAVAREQRCPLGQSTIFLDSIEKMDLKTQRVCLEFLERLQSRRSERSTGFSMRVVAGAASRLDDVRREGKFLPSLLDILDKVRLELCEEGGPCAWDNAPR